jgi:hypothetical protein
MNRDVARIDLKKENLETPVDQFTIERDLVKGKALWQPAGRERCFRSGFDSS